MLPTALLAIVRIGGDKNNFGIILYFLLLACALILIQIESDSSTEHSEIMKRVTRSIPLILVIIFIFVGGLSLYRVKRTLGELSGNPEQVAYEYLKSHPGEAYFPSNPVSHVMAEGKFYHTEPALWARKMAGLRISNEHFRKYAPAKIMILAFSDRTERGDYPISREYLPEFSRITTIPGFLRWLVLTRDQSRK